jgi:hypothetical protein
MLVQADKEGKLADVSPDLAGINKAAEINMQPGQRPIAGADDAAGGAEPSRSTIAQEEDRGEALMGIP